MFRARCIVFVFSFGYSYAVYLAFHRCVVRCAMGGIANSIIFTYFTKKETKLRAHAARLRVEWEWGMNGKPIELRHGTHRQISLNFSPLLELVQQSNFECFGPKWISLSKFGRFLFSLFFFFPFFAEAHFLLYEPVMNHIRLKGNMGRENILAFWYTFRWDEADAPKIYAVSIAACVNT